MRNIIYLLLAVALFGLAYVIWTAVGDDGGLASQRSARGLGPRSLGPAPSGLMAFVEQWQPTLTLLSSIGGTLSLIMQVRVWLRGRG